MRKYLLAIINYIYKVIEYNLQNLKIYSITTKNITFSSYSNLVVVLKLHQEYHQG